jgi:hypothetical protein
MSLTSTAPVAVSRFAQKRAGVHSRVSDEFLRFLEHLQSEIAKYDHFFRSNPPDRPRPHRPIFFDSVSQNFEVRQLIFAEDEVYQLELSKRRLALKVLLQLQGFVREGVELFRSPTAIRENVCYKVDPAFFALDYSNISARETGFQQRLSYYADLLRRRIAGYLKPLWESDYPGFLQSILRDVRPHVREDFAYFPPMECEVGLSRCFFVKGSKLGEQIDPIIADSSKQDPTLFVKQLAKLGYRLIPDRDSHSPEDQSVLLLLFFRMLLNRAYENNPGLFCPQIDPDAGKFGGLVNYPARLFELPHALLGEPVGERTLGEVFRADPAFSKAAATLFGSIFHSNPIDTLYDCHECLLMIHRGALANKVGEPEVSPEETAEILSFDDLFSLFFAVMVVSELPDFFYVGWFVMNFVPKDAIATGFEYVLANLEALVIHSRKFSVEALLGRAG